MSQDINEELVKLMYESYSGKPVEEETPEAQKEAWKEIRKIASEMTKTDIKGQEQLVSGYNSSNTEEHHRTR